MLDTSIMISPERLSKFYPGSEEIRTIKLAKINSLDKVLCCKLLVFSLRRVGYHSVTLVP